MNVTHQSHWLRRLIVGGITTMILAGSTVAFAGQAAAMPPRDTDKTQGCIIAEMLVAGAWNYYQSVKTIPYTGTAAYEHYNNMRALRSQVC